mmetsp:Transcript_9103/g.26426  ORF Transcript_9103/g.26426 Transcript_9103/m.26426 type:complete len:415 (-) Transcript_9103:547-1791(-)
MAPPPRHGCTFPRSAYVLVLLFATARADQEPAGLGAAEETTRYEFLDALSAHGLEKWYFHGAGPCDLGTWIHSMGCRSDVRGAACCAGMKFLFEQKCACVPLPDIVAANGGSAAGIVVDQMRCGMNDEDLTSEDPIDYVANRLLCVDQPEWCARGIPNVDVRLSQYERGRVQIKNEAYAWANVQVDAPNRDTVARTICKAMGYSSFHEHFTTSVKEATRHLSCPSSAAATGYVPACTVTHITPTREAFGVRCTGGHEPTVCIRANQEHSHAPNTIACFGSSPVGVSVPEHKRKVGGITAVCGTAGIDETKTNWFDGIQDDYEAYKPVRDANGRVTGIVPAEYLHGVDMLSRAEYTHASERRREAEAMRDRMHAQLWDMKWGSSVSAEDVFRYHYADVLAGARMRAATPAPATGS